MSAMASCSLVLLMSILISLLFIFAVRSESVPPAGFTVDLIHRDSPQSPSYNASHTPYERLRDSIRRSFSRQASFRRAYLHRTPDSFDTTTVPDSGAYLMKIHLGSPRKEITAYADTGSDLTWTQCSPCQCYNQTAPLFSPETSTSYLPVDCMSPQCTSLGHGSYSCSNDRTCMYEMVYGDMSHSNGDLAVDILTFVSPSSGEPTLYDRFYFGCGRDNNGTFTPNSSGIIGLGGGKISLIRQLENSIRGKFSYCLTETDSHAASKISFGANAAVTGPAVVSTPLVKRGRDTFYRITLEGISIGATRIEHIKTEIIEGNMIVDSGTTLTFISSDMYNLVESALVKVIDGERTRDPLNDLGLCYRLPGFSAPPVTVHFTGADLVLPATSTFVKVNDDVTCFTFVPNVVGIFGNMHQMNFHVGYDLWKGMVNFKPMDCTKNV